MPAHTGTWELEVSDHETHLQVLHRATLLSGYGNNKHQCVLNANTRRSSAQGLDLVPSAVGVREVRKVADVVWKTLHFLARNSLLEPNAFEYRGRYQGRPFDFWSFRELLKNAA
jgi:hypothetical protein